jgi:hypothetical protein
MPKSVKTPRRLAEAKNSLEEIEKRNALQMIEAEDNPTFGFKKEIINLGPHGLTTKSKLFRKARSKRRKSMIPSPEYGTPVSLGGGQRRKTHKKRRVNRKKTYRKRR